MSECRTSPTILQERRLVSLQSKLRRRRATTTARIRRKKIKRKERNDHAFLKIFLSPVNLYSKIAPMLTLTPIRVPMISL